MLGRYLVTTISYNSIIGTSEFVKGPIDGIVYGIIILLYVTQGKEAINRGLALVQKLERKQVDKFS